MSIDTRQTETTRTVLGLMGVFGKVGGITGVFTLFFTSIFAPYSLLCFKIDIIHKMFDVKTQEDHLLDDERPTEIKISFLDKIKLMTGCFASKK